MAKARREVQEKLKLVDFVIELVDARAPLASQNPMLHQVLQQKPKMRVLMKKDLADPERTTKWIKKDESEGIPAVAVDVSNRQDIQRVIEVAKKMAEEKMARLARKGVRPRAARAMIIGIPNVGKSTLINRLANRKIAKTGDRPGITTAQQWIKVKKDFELLDTPGILWPKFEDQQVGYQLAAIGTIKDQLLPLEDVAYFILDYLKANYPSFLTARYKLENVDIDQTTLFNQIGQLRGCLASGGSIDVEKTADLIIRELRSGKIGRVSFEIANQ